MKKLLLGASLLAAGLFSFTSCGTKSFKNEVEYEKFYEELEKSLEVLNGEEYFNRDYIIKYSENTNNVTKNNETGEYEKMKSVEEKSIKFDKENTTSLIKAKSNATYKSNLEKGKESSSQKYQLQKTGEFSYNFNLKTRTCYVDNDEINDGKLYVSSMISKVDYDEIIEGAKYYVDKKNDLAIYTINYVKDESRDGVTSINKKFYQIVFDKNSIEINIDLSIEYSNGNSSINNSTDVIKCSLEFKKQNIDKLDLQNFKYSSFFQIK